MKEGGSLAGRRIIITGGAGGIGDAAVAGLAALGARVAATYRSSPPAREGNGVRWHACDLSDSAAVDAVFGRVAAELGGLDALVNIAGLWRPGVPGELDAGQIEGMITANLMTAIFSNQAAFRLMRETGGRIVNFGSIEGVEGAAGSAAYAAAKGAVHAWTRSAARAWGQCGVTVNAVAPTMWTPAAHRSMESMSAEARGAMEARFKERIPLGGTMGDPARDCVPVLAFLAGEGSRFVTGQLISVDGGMRMLGA